MTSANARIASNMVALYVRTIVTALVSLYTSRIVLDQLGLIDFGIWGLVGSLVILASFFRAAIGNSTQRFLNFSLEKDGIDEARKVFATALSIHLMLAAAVFLIALSAGSWVLNNVARIEAERLGAANFVLVFATLSFMVSLATTPFNAAIVANERMTAFAYTSLLEAVLRLGTAFMLQISGPDKLKLYSVLMFLVSLIMAGVFIAFATSRFPESRTRPRIEHRYFSEMVSFSSWTTLSQISILLRLQGINLLLNVFFGTPINSSMSIATQVNNNIRNLYTTFTAAISPQLVKSYAAGDIRKMHNHIFNGCKISFFLLLFFSLPIILETEIILALWLTTVPPYAVIFVRLILLQSLVEVFAAVTGTAQGATGKVRTYHITLTAVGILNLPVSYLFLRAGAPPYVTFYVAIIISAVVAVIRVLFLRKSVGLSVRAFATRVVTRCVLVALASVVPVLLVRNIYPPGLSHLILVTGTSMLAVLAAVWGVGLTASERARIGGMAARRLRWS
ncbi:MAG: hypothetical protein SNJ79_08660 [Sphingomonadaceae bacterium]